MPDSLSDKLRMVVGINIRLIFVPISGSKATGVEKVVEHLGLKPENVMVFGDGLNDLDSLIMLESALQWEFLMIKSKKKQII